MDFQLRNPPMDTMKNIANMIPETMSSCMKSKTLDIALAGINSNHWSAHLRDTIHNATMLREVVSASPMVTTLSESRDSPKVLKELVLVHE